MVVPLVVTLAVVLVLLLLLVVVVRASEFEVTESELEVAYVLNDVLEEDVVVYNELDDVEDE